MAAHRSTTAWLPGALAGLALLPPLSACVAVGTPQPVAATEAELEASAEAPPPFCPRSGGLPLGAPSPLSIDELRALVGQPLADPRTREALARLGPASVEPDGSGLPLREHLHARFGIIVVVDGEGDEGRVRRVDLRGSSMHPVYNGVLPDGLSFHMDVARTFATLGPPDERSLYPVALQPHHHATRGLMVEFSDEGCLSRVGLTTTLAPGAARFDDLVVDGEARDRGGATGIAVRFTRALGAFPAPGTEVRIGVELVDGSGGAVRALDRHGAALGPLRAERVVVPHETLTSTIFLPFVMLDLPPGPHRLRVRPRARVMLASGPEELEPSGETEAELELMMPPLVEARFGVRDVRVRPGDYDAAMELSARGVSTHFRRPDLRWQISREVPSDGSDFVGTWFSSTKEDTFHASFAEHSAPFLVAPEDSLLLCIEDDDLAIAAEELGCVGITLERARKVAREGTVLSDRRVEHLRLAAPREQPRARRSP